MNSIDNEINVTRDMAITVPSGDSESCMAIRRYDWERISRRLLQLKDSDSKLPIVYSILFGVAVSSGVTIIPLTSSEGLPSWITPFYMCLFIFSLICAGVFVVVDKKIKTDGESNVQDILNDMELVENLYSQQ